MGSLKTYSSDLTDAEWQRIEPRSYALYKSSQVCVNEIA